MPNQIKKYPKIQKSKGNPSVYLTTSIYRARNHSEGGPRRSGDSTNLEIKAYRGYLEPSYVDDSTELIYYAFHVTNQEPIC